jgi:hypothetical protein
MRRIDGLISAKYAANNSLGARVPLIYFTEIKVTASGALKRCF